MVLDRVSSLGDGIALKWSCMDMDGFQNRAVGKKIPLFFLCDCSGSMSNGLLEQLNVAIPNVFPAIQKTISAHLDVMVSINVIRFSDYAEWHLYDTPLTCLQWLPLTNAEGITSPGSAYRLMGESLKQEAINESLSPIAVLFSDGKATDDELNALNGIRDILTMTKTVCFGLGIGSEADRDTLMRFVQQDSTRVVMTDTFSALNAWAQQFVQRGLLQVLNN